MQVGSVPAGATSLRIANQRGLQGVDSVALVDEAAFLAARDASATRLAAAPTTLVAQAETVPALAASTVTLAGVGRVAQVADAANVSLDVPAPGDYTVWLRVPASAPAPRLALDDAALPAPACAAECGEAATWIAAPAGRLAPGAHVLRIGAGEGPAMLDVVALSSDPGFA